MFALLMLITTCDCFNVDVDNVVHIKGPHKSQFGYSALMFINDDYEKWVVVGATKANFTSHNNFTTPGNVYKCRLNFTTQKQEDCTAMNLEQTGTFRNSWSPGYEADNELQGASMAMIDDTIVTCAPLWKNWLPCGELCADANNCNSKCKTHPVGRCFNVHKTLKNYTTDTFQTKPLEEDIGVPNNDSHYLYQFAQIGFSISQKKSDFASRPVLMGAPGLIENSGGFVLYDINNTSETHRFFDAFAPKAIKGEHGFHDGDLMGYSVTTGIVANNSGCTSVVIYGAPHYITVHGITGSVLVVCISKTGGRKSMEIIKQLFGEKSGGGFGTSIVFQDFNNDGLDDLLVSEPLFFDMTTNAIDVGAVYIYYGSNDPSDTLPKSGQVLRGSGKNQGRFGTSMECIGDINKDSYNDIVISAPYEDELKGAVYIYHGGKSSLALAQRITPKDIGVMLQSFGWYISASYDIDRNQYPDFLVGSYMSDTVSVFRSRPVINLHRTFEIIPQIIPLNSSGQLCEDQYFRPCVTVELCFTYTGKYIPEKIRLYYNMSADVARTQSIPSKISRVSLIGDGKGNKTFTQGFIDVEKENRSCVIQRATVQTLDREFFTSLKEPLVFKTEFELTELKTSGELRPVLRNDINVIQNTSAIFSTGCNGTCHPDLQINTKQDAEVVFLGDVSEVVLKVYISNKGDASYGTQLLIDYSNNTEYIAYSQPQDEDTQLIFCEDVTNADNASQVECNMKTPFYQHQMVAVIVRFAVTSSLLFHGNRTIGNFNQYIVVRFVVQSTSPDNDVRDNNQTIRTTVKLKSSVELTEISIPDQIQISESGDGGLVFTHSYSIFNHGPSPLTNYNFKICLPVMTANGKMLISKDVIQVTTSDPYLSWAIVQFPEEHLNHSTTMTTPVERSDITTTDVKKSTSTFSSLPTQVTTEIRGNLKFGVITCEGTPDDRLATIEVHIEALEENTGITFELPFNLSESVLEFKEVFGIIFKTNTELSIRNDERYVTMPYNTTYNIVYASTEIYGREKVVAEVKKISIWIIIGSSVGGLALLVILFLALKRFGFFQRKKREDVKKWKRQSGYYAERRSRLSTVSPKVKSVNWQALNNEFLKDEETERTNTKLVTIKEETSAINDPLD